MYRCFRGTCCIHLQNRRLSEQTIPSLGTKFWDLCTSGILPTLICYWVFVALCFNTMYWPHLQVLVVRWHLTCSTWRWEHCIDLNVGSNHPVMECNIPEEQGCWLYHFKTLKTRPQSCIHCDENMQPHHSLVCLLRSYPCGVSCAEMVNDTCLMFLFVFFFFTLNV
jgi:hypothetical protein